MVRQYVIEHPDGTVSNGQADPKTLDFSSGVFRSAVSWVLLAGLVGVVW